MTKILVLTLCVLCVLIPQVARAACEKPTSAHELAEAWSVAQEAFAKMDTASLLTQASLARTQILPCMGEALPKQGTAAFHRLMALEAFINGDDGRTVRELHASLLLEPGYEFAIEVVDASHPLRDLYEVALTADDGEGEKIYPPPGGYVLVGGVRNAARYSQTPVIMQVFDATQTLRETRYVQPGEASPNWSGNAFGLTAEDIGINLDELRRPRTPTDPRPWFVAAGVSAIIGGVLYAVAMQQKSLYQDPTTLDEDLAGLQSRANGLGTASLLLGGTALVFTGFGIGFQVKFGSTHKTTITPHSSDALGVGAPTGASGEAASP